MVSNHEDAQRNNFTSLVSYFSPLSPLFVILSQVLNLCFMCTVEGLKQFEGLPPLRLHCQIW